MGISIFSCSSASDYLQKHIKNLPLNGRGEASKIAKHLNVSTTYISQILSGSRSMTFEQNIELSQYLGLDQNESDYFMLLISKERAGSHKLKEYFQTKLTALKEQASKLVHHIKPKNELKNEDKAIFYSSPAFSEVMLFTALKKEGVTLEEIKNRFNL